MEAPTQSLAETHTNIHAHAYTPKLHACIHAHTHSRARMYRLCALRGEREGVSWAGDPTLLCVCFVLRVRACVHLNRYRAQGWCSKVASWAKNCSKAVTTCEMSMNQTSCCATNMCTWTPLDAKMPVPCSAPKPPAPPEPPAPPKPTTFSCEFLTPEECDANACCNWYIFVCCSSHVLALGSLVFICSMKSVIQYSLSLAFLFPLLPPHPRARLASSAIL